MTKRVAPLQWVGGWEESPQGWLCPFLEYSGLLRSSRLSSGNVEGHQHLSDVGGVWQYLSSFSKEEAWVAELCSRSSSGTPPPPPSSTDPPPAPVQWSPPEVWDLICALGYKCQRMVSLILQDTYYQGCLENPGDSVWAAPLDRARLQDYSLEGATAFLRQTGTAAYGVYQNSSRVTRTA